MDDRNTPLIPSPPAGTQPITSHDQYAGISQVSTPTPTREPSFRKGAYTGNILRLEQSAEKMSEGGSDIGEEIRKMNELERQRSRQNSIQSSHQGDSIPGRTAPLAPLETTRSRTSSNYTQSAVSAVEANNVARWGGYSPSGFVTSPTGSVRSHGSWGMNRKPSVSSKLSHMVEPIQEGRPLDSPLAPSLKSPLSNPSMSRQPSQASVSSFGAKYDMISAQIQEQLDDVPPTPTRLGEIPPMHLDDMQEGVRDGEEQGEGTFKNSANTPPTRPRSADTFQEAELAFKDFDGVHFLPETEEIVQVDEEGNEVRRVSARTSSGSMSMAAASLLRAPQGRPDSFAMPPPAENTTYYPAPVPRMLNLPKRLSQMPSASVHAKRRDHIIGQLPPGSRQSVPWLSQTDLSGYNEQRRSGSGSQPGDHPRGALNERMSMQNLPAQLRASVFFEQQSVPHNVELQNQSAVATLESILNASATAPVDAFTHHPFAGDVRNTHFAPERPTTRHSTNTLLAQTQSSELEAKNLKRRTTSLGNLLKRASSGDQLSDALKRPGSRGSMSVLDFNEGGKRLQKRKSRASMLDMQEQEETAHGLRTPGDEVDLSGGLVAQAENGSPVDERRQAENSRPATAMSGGKMLTENEQIEADFREQGADEGASDGDEGEASFVQPSTLLAELQVRKAQLKSRNRTAATAYPQGMHSTLLQMDAVLEIDKRKRQKQRIALAWEDPALRQNEEEKGDEDDDVPLGMLYPSKNGLINRKLGDERDWDRPLGLMEKRELENNEPLSSRRNRLRGGPALPRKPPVPVNSSQLNLAVQPPDDEPEKEEEDGETLAQRLKRLRTKEALDSAVKGLSPGEDGDRPLSTWSNDVLSQFGGLDAKDGDESKGNPNRKSLAPLPAPTPEELENETLGQRRARLQREREASGGAAPDTTAQPAVRASSSMANLLTNNPAGSANRKAPNDHRPAAGTLLHASAQEKEQARRQLLKSNMRSSSYAIDRQQFADQRRAMPARAVSNFAMPQQHQSPTMPSGFGGAYNGLPTSNSTPMFGGAGYFAAPPQPAMSMYAQPQVNSSAYQALTGAAPVNYGMPYGQPMGYGMPMGMNMNMGMNMPMGMNMGMGMPMATGGAVAYEEGITPQKRDKIDQWRMGVGGS
ncbi:hypothetical protein Q7P37_007854 [Cladosporium fusiforme]